MDHQTGEGEGGDEIRHEITEHINRIQPPPKAILEMEYVFEALAHPRRRYLLYSLLSSTEWTLRELATKLVAWENDIPEETVSEFERDEMFVSLYHAHVPKLVDHDIVKYTDGDKSVIVAAKNAVQVLAALEGIGASVDTAQEAHARRKYNDKD